MSEGCKWLVGLRPYTYTCACLQGLIPRVTSLAQLGGSFFLAFLPAVFFISLVFSAIYFVSLPSVRHCLGRSLPGRVHVVCALENVTVQDGSLQWANCEL